MPKKLSVTRSSSEEIANPGDVTREQVLHRLEDWRDRVHKLYAEVEQALQGTPFRVDRAGKHASREELPQRRGIAPNEQPQVDVLRIVRPDGTNAATLFPRGLWIIGANGRVDLRITPSVGGSEVYMLLDVSDPLSGPAKWMHMPIGTPFNREPFHASWLTAKLQ